MRSDPFSRREARKSRHNRRHKVDDLDKRRASIELRFILIFVFFPRYAGAYSIAASRIYMRLTCVAFGHRLVEPPIRRFRRSEHSLPALNTNGLACGSPNNAVPSDSKYSWAILDSFLEDNSNSVGVRRLSGQVSEFRTQILLPADTTSNPDPHFHDPIALFCSCPL